MSRSFCLWLWGTGPLTGEVPGLGPLCLMNSLGQWPKAPGNQRAALCGVERRLVDSEAQPDTGPSLARTPGKMRLQSCDVN